MELIHHLATKANVIPLGEPEFSTRHREAGGQVTHRGWSITAPYAGDVERNKKHRYELLFTPEEAQEFAHWLLAMLPNLQGPGLPAIALQFNAPVSAEDADEEAVEDEDEEAQD